MVLFGGVEDEGRNFGVDVVRGGGDGYDELLVPDRVGTEGSFLRAPLTGRQLFVVVVARPSLQPEEGIYEDCSED